ncbi:MAG: hypothetical protein Q8P36_01585 [bacterium]|nr:hypothetical protein [bacterium]
MPIFNSSRPIRERLRLFASPDPTRDWLVLVTGSAIVLTGIIVWNAWAFDTVASGGTIGEAASTAPPPFNRSSLDAIQGVFDARAAEEAKYLTGIYRYSDPSQ